MTGIEFDRSLREGQRQGRSVVPDFGRLLAATENGGSRAIAVDPGGFHGRLIAVFTCDGTVGGVDIRVTRSDRSLLHVRSAGCNPENLNTAVSPAIGYAPAGQSDQLAVTVTAEPGVATYSVVVEEVAEKTSWT